MKVSRHSFPQHFKIVSPPARRGARKNGRVPNETMTCHGWDGNPSLLQVLGLAFRPPVFFPRNVPRMFQDVPRAADAREIPPSADDRL